MDNSQASRRQAAARIRRGRIPYARSVTMFRAGILSLVCLVVAAAATASGQTVLNGISFLDRNQTREVVLGAYRGPIAVIDYDEDGYPDLIIGDSPGRMKRLFHNVPDGGRPGARTFVDATIGSGIDEPDGTAR